MKPLAPNTLLQNRYLIVQLIGKGGMGEVYLAVDQRLGSAVALKRTFFSDDEMLGTAFEREARTLARLRHPVLPKVSDHFTENDTQYLVMEHITGDDLSKRLEITNKPFPLNWVLFWADQLLDALAYLHSHEPPIIHRDIKPQNLKLTDENHIVLLDFGLAKNAVGNTHVSSTTGGSIVGYTPHYAPMEQIRGTGTNPRSDIYSFAATFYQLLTNVVPPDALTRADNVLNGIPDPTKPLTEENPEVPTAISNVILRGMALSMEQRYASARDMQKALREAYAEMQSVMSAQTMAFNVPSHAQNQSIAQSSQPTDQFSAGTAGQYPAQDTQSTEVSEFDSFAGAKAGDAPGSIQPNGYPSQAQNFSQSPDFDATMKDDSQSFGIKTEVIPKEKLPRAEDYAPVAPPEKFNTDEFSAAEREDFNPNATIAPLINFSRPTEDQHPLDSGFDSQPKREASYAAAANTIPRNQSVSQTAPINSQPGLQAESKKKSNGKALAIAGGIGSFMIVAIGAGAIGWYALKPSTATVSPTPLPTVEAAATPVIEPTVEPTIEADANTSTDSSTEVVSSTPENPVDDTKPERSTTTERPPTQTGQPNQPRAVPTPRVVTVKTPIVVKPTPAPVKTPAKPDRTDILQ